MIVKINGTQLPVETSGDLEPITIKAAISNGNGTSGWAGEFEIELDSGADCSIISLPVLKKLLGENLKFNDEPHTLETADGVESSVRMTKISLRIKTDNGEVVTLLGVNCVVPDGGSALLGRDVLALFRITLVQNKIQEMILAPKARTWLALAD